MNNNVLVTYIYPQAVNFFLDFIGTINEQTTEDFEVVIFNDGVKSATAYFENINRRFQIINLDGSIADIRFQSLDILKKLNYNNIVFQDIDDLMSENRMEVSIKLLKKYSLICNDLSPFNGCKTIKSNIWRKRLGKGFKFTYKFLNDKNIVGFGNTSLRRELLDFQLKKNYLPVAVDWFIFYQILFNFKGYAFFTSECFTKYRQHEANIIGIKDEVTKESLLTIVDTKIAHFKALIEIGVDFSDNLHNAIELKKKLKSSNSPHVMNKSGLFWWEQTKYL